MKYKGQGKIFNIGSGSGKIKSLKVKMGSILRLTQTELIINQIIPIVFGGHFGVQSPSVNGNYVT